MGCGQSQNVKQVSPVSSVKYPENIAVIYFCSEKGQIIDLSRNFLKEPVSYCRDNNKIFDPEIINFSSLEQKLESAQKIVYIIRTDAKDSIQLWFSEMKVSKIGQDNFHYIYVTTTSNTSIEASGSLQDMYKLLNCLSYVNDLNTKLAFVDRQAWFSAQDYNQIVLSILEKNEQFCFYPKGAETRDAIKESYEQVKKVLYNRRMFFSYIASEGVEEDAMLKGEEYLLDALGKQTEQYDNVPMKQVQIVPDSINPEKYVIPLGSESKELTKHCRNILKLSDINENYNFANKEFLFVIDTTEKCEQSFLDGEFMSYCPSATFMGIHLIDKELDQQGNIVYILSVALENIYGNLLVNKDNPNNKNLIDTLLNLEGSLSQIVEQLVPYPRLNFLTPFYNRHTMLELSDSSLNDEKAILSAVHINEVCNIPKSSFLGIDNIPNRQIIKKSSAQHKITITSHFSSLVNFLQKIASEENFDVNVEQIKALYDYTDEDQLQKINDSLLNIQDSSSEYSQYIEDLNNPEEEQQEQEPEDEED